MTKLHELADLGQAVWFDYIQRSLITSGELQKLVDLGIRGVTSNPSIFEKAIVGSDDYDEVLQSLAYAGKSLEEIYEALVVDDIQHAADVFRPLYDKSKGGDGYISLEVDPTLAYDTVGTIAEAKRLFTVLGRPNIMIKVPATLEGISAIKTLIGEGININITLIFSIAQYKATVRAYIAGLEKYANSGGDVSKVASVASFFVSRIDRAVDQVLEDIGGQQAEALMGKIATASVKVAYARFKEMFNGSKWEKLSTQSARVQRPLWASTSTKNPAYSDTLYIDGLIGPDTVNTVPPLTLDAFLDHGRVAMTVESGVDEAQAQLASLAELGVNLKEITQKLLDDGVEKFAKSFEALMTSITENREKYLGRL